MIFLRERLRPLQVVALALAIVFVVLDLGLWQVFIHCSDSGLRFRILQSGS